MFNLSSNRIAPDDHPAFAGLPVERYCVGPASEAIAVHVAGQLGTGRIPLLCIPGYQRNMADFADFCGYFRRSFGADWPVILVDLKGRGRSSDRGDKTQYLSTVDARDVVDIVAALAVESVVVVGQGHGGQVAMVLAADRPNLVAGTVLLDAGPTSDPRGLIRLRNNLKDLEGPRSEAGFRAMLRRMLAQDYPAMPDVVLETLGSRTHFLDRRGRVRGLFDPHLIKMLEAFEYDDVLVPQWPLYDALRVAPLLLMRTQLTEQLRRETFDEMMRRRPDAEAFAIEGQGSPALLNTPEDAEPIVEFVRKLVKRKTSRAA